MRIAAGVRDALGAARDVTSDVPKDPEGRGDLRKCTIRSNQVQNIKQECLQRTPEPHAQV